MKVTETHIYIHDSETNFRGFAKIVLDGELAITGIKIHSGKFGLFVSMPRKQKSDGEYADVVFPISENLRKHISEVVIKEFNKKRMI